MGLGCASVVRTRPNPGVAHLLAAMDPDQRDRLFHHGLKAYGITIEAPPGLQVTQQRGDWVFTALAVRDAGATKVLVQTLDAGGSRQLYEKLGFVPLVRISEQSDDPSDPTAMTLLCALLV